MKFKTLLICCILAVTGNLCAQTTKEFKSVIPSLKGEKWWGGLVALGSQMPYDSNTAAYNLATQNLNNQVVPLFVSSSGRSIWSDYPFTFQFHNDTLIITSLYEKVEVLKPGNTLKEAYLAASERYFPASGKYPEPIFFSKPQYNTWIELMYDQNQEDILNYASKILEHNLPTGILMIDDNWQKYYGNFEFKPEKFSDAKQMIQELHNKDFKVMLWVCPFVSPDSPEFRELAAKDYLIKDAATGKPAIIHWWNGFSACYDMTNPGAVNHLRSALDKLCNEYGVDGFKFDAGDVSYMQGDYIFYDNEATPSVFAQKWAELGLHYPYNELRTSWKLGGEALVQRLGDKDYSWGATELLIPDMVAAGLLGHLYTCPDMIGGGQFSAFLNIDSDSFDQELIVRSCQVHAMMPMMQFSVAPWRILDQEHLDICVTYAHWHESMGDYILKVAKNSSQTGEPMIRHMEYAFPHQGFEECNDQFMLGDDYLVAPMLQKGSLRTVHLPKGVWLDDQGKKHRGPQKIEIEVPLQRLPYYKRLK